MEECYWALACNFTKSNTHLWVFSYFLNCTNGTTKLPKTSQIFTWTCLEWQSLTCSIAHVFPKLPCIWDKQTISLQIFWRLSSTNFTWSTLEYFVPYGVHLMPYRHFNALCTFSLPRVSNRHVSPYFNLEFFFRGPLGI